MPLSIREAGIAGLFLILWCRDVPGMIPPEPGRDLSEETREIWKRTVRPLALPEPNQGGPVLVILFETIDRQADRNLHPPSYYEALLFGESGSLASFWSEATGGLVDLRGEVLSWITLRDSMRVYRNDLSHLAYDGIEEVGRERDWSRYDWDGDGTAEGIFFIHAGPGAESSGRDDDIWSQVRNVDLGDEGPPVGTAAFLPEDGKLGVYAHEAGHLLGLPDLYDRTLRSLGLGYWSLMAYGAWAGRGESPVGLDAWSRVMLGVPVSGPPDRREWRVVPGPGDPPLRLPMKGSVAEYFLLSNREQAGIDSLLPVGGIEILHINDRYSNNDDPDHYRVALEQADGRFDLESNPPGRSTGDSGDLFPGTTGNWEFHSESTPSSRTRIGDRTGVALRFEVLGSSIAVDGTLYEPMKAEIEIRHVYVRSGGRLGRLVAGLEGEVELVVRNRGDGPSGPWNLGLDGEEGHLSVRGVTPAVPALQPGERTTSENSPRFLVRPSIGERGPDIVHLLVSGGEGVSVTPDTIALQVLPADGPGWPVTSDSWGVGGPAIHEGGILVASLDGRIDRIDEEGRRTAWAQLTAPLSGTPVMADIDGDGREEVACIDEEGTVTLFDEDGSRIGRWPLLSGEPGGNALLLLRESDLSWSIVVTGGGAVHRLGVDGQERDGWPLEPGGENLTGPCVFPGAMAEMIAIGTNQGKLALFDSDGSHAPGWPVQLRSGVKAAPVVAQFGAPALVTIDGAGNIHAFHEDGRSLPGWPVATGKSLSGAHVAACDLDGDGADEVVALAGNRFFVVDQRGVVLPGWPVQAGFGLQRSPLVADVDGDGDLEIIGATVAGGLFAWDPDAVPVPGWPIPPVGLAGIPILADLDRNGIWELIVQDSERGWDRFEIRGEKKMRPAWATARGDRKGSGRVPETTTDYQNLAVLIDTTALFAGSWAGDTIDVPVEVVNRGSEASRPATLQAGLSTGGEESRVRIPLGLLEPGTSIQTIIPFVLPFPNLRPDSLQVEIVPGVRETDTADNRLIVPIPRAIPGRSFIIPGFDLPTEEISWNSPLLVRGVLGWLLPYDINRQAEIQGRQVRGTEVVAGKGQIVYVAEGRIEKLVLETGERTALSLEGNEASRPALGGGRIAWVEPVCGAGGEGVSYTEAGGTIKHIPIEGSVDGRPLLNQSALFWLERLGADWKLNRYDFESRSIDNPVLAKQPIMWDVSEIGGFAWIEKVGEKNFILFRDGPIGATDTVHTATRPIEWIGLDAQIIAWMERCDGGVTLLVRRLKGGRAYPAAFLRDGISSPAFSGSTLVWIDHGVSPESVRGVALDLPKTMRDPTAGFRFRFAGLREDVSEVLIEWRVEGNVPAGRYAVFRFPRGEAGPEGSQAIVEGVIDGPGHYYYRDHSFPPGEEPTEWDYYVNLFMPTGDTRYGPITATVPGRPQNGGIRLLGPHPGLGTVRFEVAVPEGTGKSETTITIAIYDIRGRRVSSRTIPGVSTGFRDMSWDGLSDRGENLGSGIYFLRVQVGDLPAATKKIMLLSRATGDGRSGSQ